MTVQNFETLKVRVVLQRFLNCTVVANGTSCGTLNEGILLLFGVGQTETKYPHLPSEIEIEHALGQFAPSLKKLFDKLLGLRIFSDSQGKMNLNLAQLNQNLPNEPLELKSGVYVVSQFTLFADLQKGFRPGFGHAAPPSIGEAFYNFFLSLWNTNTLGIPVRHGEFGADMQIQFTNNGPVTILFEADHTGIIHSF
jgi:D-aminoacyl-tRNA deacylase